MRRIFWAKFIEALWDGKLVYAGDSTANEIQVVDVDTSSPTFGAILANIPSDNLILDLILLPDDSKLYSVDRDANQVQVIDTLTNTELTRIDVGQFPLAIALSPSQQVVGGEIIPLDTTMILLAGTQSVAAWMFPIIVSAAGIGLLIQAQKTKLKHNSCPTCKLESNDIFKLGSKIVGKCGNPKCRVDLFFVK